MSKTQLINRTVIQVFFSSFNINVIWWSTLTSYILSEWLNWIFFMLLRFQKFSTICSEMSYVKKNHWHHPPYAHFWQRSLNLLSTNVIFEVHHLYTISMLSSSVCNFVSCKIHFIITTVFPFPWNFSVRHVCVCQWVKCKLVRKLNLLNLNCLSCTRRRDLFYFQ